ncbi:hypothetical protein, partial [Pseudomonas syringae]|uniref:hypothetical protein n=1 Tax=Pseudomonas syringae TaxID=317 RepID=UPI001F28A0B4
TTGLTRPHLFRVQTNQALLLYINRKNNLNFVAPGPTGVDDKGCASIDKANTCFHICPLL